MSHSLFIYALDIHEKQVDILISKNQVLQIVYIKQHKLPWIRNLRYPQKFILNSHNIQAIKLHTLPAGNNNNEHIFICII